MNDHNMEYNSQKTKLIIPEYGRNVQMLISYACTIEDVDYRQAFVERVIQLMMQMHPQNKNIDDYRRKLWMHAFRISNFTLDVVPPDGHIPTLEEANAKPDPIGYPAKETAFRHYGHHVRTLIKKALELEPGPKQRSFMAVIGSYMKLAYKTWIKDQYISDEVIREDLKTMSKGKLVLDSSVPLDIFTSRKVSKKGPNSIYNNKDNNSRDNHRDYDRYKYKKRSNSYKRR